MQAELNAPGRLSSSLSKRNIDVELLRPSELLLFSITTVHALVQNGLQPHTHYGHLITAVF